MIANHKEFEQYLTILEDTPRRIAAACAGVSDERLAAKPDADTWSVVEILAHLRACADVWGSSIERMLKEDEPKIAYVHPRQWVKRTDYPRLAFSASLAAFAEQRRGLLAAVGGLTAEDWSRGGWIQEKEHTVFSQVRRMAMHESVHCEQIERLGSFASAAQDDGKSRDDGQREILRYSSSVRKCGSG